MLKITQEDIKKMVSKALCEIHNKLTYNDNSSMLINEISTSDAYDKFYKQIPERIYSSVMSDTNKMTPFHKAVLDVVLNLMSHGSNEDFIMKFIQNAKERYNNLTPIQKRFCVQAIKDKMFGFTNDHFDLMQILRNSAKHVEITKKQNYKNGLVVLYDDENILVTCTITYAASRHYYGNTHWCTASGINGQMSGYESFRTYVKNDGGDCCLIQFVFKKLVNEIYQGMFSENGQPLDFKDFNDEGDLDTFNGVIDYADSIVPNLYENYIQPRIPELVKLTSEAYFKEEERMRGELTKKAESIVNQNTEIPTIDELNEKLHNIKNVNGIVFKGLRVREQSNDNYTLFSLSQTTKNLSDYQFIQQTKDITKIDFKSKSFVYSWNDHKVLDIPEMFSDDTKRVLLLIGNYLFSCAYSGRYDTKTLNLKTMEVTEYNIRFVNKMFIKSRNCDAVVFDNVKGDYVFFNEKTGELISDER